MHGWESHIRKELSMHERPCMRDAWQARMHAREAHGCGSHIREELGVLVGSGVREVQCLQEALLLLAARQSSTRLMCTGPR